MLRFENGYSQTINVMIERLDQNCQPRPWRRTGWWVIAPGASAVAYGGNLAAVNRYWYWYAFAVDNTQWSGPYPENVPESVFDWCPDTASDPSINIGMRELDVNGAADWTLRLIL
ncbi:putative membrane protein [Kitasatospora sp. GAS204A]|uniref:DUF1036 domain-containing protein n=1 Tax=unclassified Kitasatospora TaxID=2633591 RepID=UPI002473E78B|nr:DUF1036 domain-containing protein [Kitasatospora sp. GAS204B]MDH6121405.1 putative membrane protein [Kitasatospora sp. GAS204B]